LGKVLRYDGLLETPVERFWKSLMGNSRTSLIRKSNIWNTFNSMIYQGLFPYSQSDLVLCMFVILNKLRTLDVDSKYSVLVSLGGNVPSFKWMKGAYSDDWEEQVQKVTDVINGLDQSELLGFRNSWFKSWITHQFVKSNTKNVLHSEAYNRLNAKDSILEDKRSGSYMNSQLLKLYYHLTFVRVYYVSMR
jgi:hypothetical protein